MAHNLTERDGFFTVRQPAWHGLGEVLPDYPTREEAQKIAHPWEPVPEPVYRKITISQPFGAPRTEYQQVPDQVLNVRSDDGAPLGVVSTSWQLVNNAEMYDIAEAIEGDDSGSVKFETGGSLMGGKKVWLLLRLRDPLIVKGDPNGAVIPYYALQNSHDATGAFRGQATLTRIVCDNTSKMADLDASARGTEFSFKHTRNVRERIEQARLALAGWRDSIDRWRLLSEHLMALPVTRHQAWTFIEEFVPLPPLTTVSDRVVSNVNEARNAINAILYGPTCEGIENTAYGLVQASVEYAQWARRARSDESRFKRSYLDRNTIIADARVLAEKVAVGS